MTILFLYLAALTGLIAVLIMIASKTLAMVRDGRPLVAVGGLQWQVAAPQAKAAPQPRQQPALVKAPTRPGALAALFARLRPAARVAAEPAAEAPPRERSRRLASLSEVNAAEATGRFHVVERSAIEFAEGAERRFEAELDRFCAGAIDLPAFAAFVAAQQIELDRYLAVPSDADTRAALDTAATIIAFSRDWVSQQQ